jgi:holo-[acyl-carrier protein] synthase
VRVGTDIIEIQRVRQALEDHGEAMLQRIFTQDEQDYCLGQADPAVHFAGRFAAKEAVAKLLGTGLASGVSFRDIQICRKESGDVVVELIGTSRQVAETLGITEIALSFSHCREYATAVAIASN